MERIALVNCAVLCVIILCLGVVLSLPHNYDTSTNDEKSDKGKESYMWFGPRLGRRKRNPNGDETFKNSEVDREREQLATLMDVLQDSPWAIVTFNEGKRHTLSFTPRLGRESGEEVSNDKWVQDSDLYGELLSQRSPPFAPRLGRRLSPYSPRLGRDNDKS